MPLCSNGNPQRRPKNGWNEEGLECTEGRKEGKGKKK
jgi:hypothetical protein